ncbi:MAG: hypothetical protein NTV14_05810, partial [Coprothermobacterota bacterium]|nr:hypothetical protein [Coprothermobacterota bacterium]
MAGVAARQPLFLFLALSHIEWVRQFEGNKIPGTIGFPGTAAPQCGISSNKTEANRSGDQQPRGWRSRGYLAHFDTEH